MLHHAMNRSLGAFLMLGLIAVGSATSAAAEEAASEPSLYERLGGVYAVASVVDVFIDRLLVNDTLNANPAIDEARKRVLTPGLKHRVTAFMAQATGGSQVYTGRSMPESHDHLNINDRQWRAMMAELEAVLYKFNVADPERTEVLELVGTLRDQIVTASAAD